MNADNGIILSQYIHTLQSRLICIKTWLSLITFVSAVSTRGEVHLRHSYVIRSKVSEWLLSISYIMARTSYIRWDDNDVWFVLYSASSLKQQICRSTRTHYPDSEPANQSLLFLLNAACLAEKQLISSFDIIYNNTTHIDQLRKYTFTELLRIWNQTILSYNS